MLVKLLNLKVIRLKQAKILFTDGGGKFVPPAIQASVNFRDFEELYLC